MNKNIEKILVENGFTVNHNTKSISKEIWRNRYFG